VVTASTSTHRITKHDIEPNLRRNVDKVGLRAGEATTVSHTFAACWCSSVTQQRGRRVYVDETTSSDHRRSTNESLLTSRRRPRKHCVRAHLGRLWNNGTKYARSSVLSRRGVPQCPTRCVVACTFNFGFHPKIGVCNSSLDLRQQPLGAQV
jgi:hypothetical protein